MTQWRDIAKWVGPTVNQGGEMEQHRGVVLHIAEGFYGGTIAWQRKKGVDVSSHFIAGRNGECAQMVDTDRVAWTQQAGNGLWLSVECEGFTPGHRLHRKGWERLTTKQLDVVAAILVKAHRQYRVPVQIATSEQGRGLGHHSMGAGWGHKACPGPAIIGQKSEIINRAQKILHPALPIPTQEESTMVNLRFAKLKTSQTTFVGDGVQCRPLLSTAAYGQITAEQIASGVHRDRLTPREFVTEAELWDFLGRRVDR